MNQPDIGDVHVNALLTDVSIGYMNDPNFYIADKVFPQVASEKQSNLYAKYNRGDFFQGSEDVSLTSGLGGELMRTPGTEAKKIGYRVANEPFFCNNYAIGVDIPDELRGNADAVFQLDEEATRLCTEVLTIRREIEFVGKAFRTGVWGTDLVGNTDFTKFSDYGGSDPFAVFDDQLDAMELATGKRPNKLVIGPIVWRRLKHHPDFIDRIKGGATTGAPALLTKQQMAQMLEIDEVLVGRGIYRSTPERTGNDTPTLARLFGDSCLIINTPPFASRFQPAAGATFYWAPLTGGGTQFIRRYREDKKRKDVVEAHGYWSVHVTDTQSGIFLSDAVD